VGVNINLEDFMDKTRKVNVVMFEDDGWKIALNLPETGVTKVMTPFEAFLIAGVLHGQTTAARAAGIMPVGGTRIKEIVSCVKRNVDDDLWPVVGTELDNMAMLARATQRNQNIGARHLVEQPANEYVM
jgi:hypothetical protein